MQIGDVEKQDDNLEQNDDDTDKLALDDASEIMQIGDVEKQDDNLEQDDDDTDKMI